MRRDETIRAALLAQLNEHLEKAQNLVAVLADAMPPAPPAPTTDGCQHDGERRDVTTMGNGPRKEMCLQCGETITIGSSSTDDASEET